MNNLTPEQLQAIRAAVEEALKSQNLSPTAKANEVNTNQSVGTDIISLIPGLVTGVITGATAGLGQLVASLTQSLTSLLGSLAGSAVAPQLVNVIKEYVPVQNPPSSQNNQQ